MEAASPDYARQCSKPAPTRATGAARDGAGGILHVSYHDVKLIPDELLAAINRQTNGEPDQQLAAAIAADAGHTVDWLASQGAAFTEPSPIGWGTALHWRRRACR